MNDPNKAINVNLSSLLSLKAELLRKQAEVSKAKATRTLKEEYSSAPTAIKNSKWEKKNKTIEVNKNQNGAVYEHEDSTLLEKSKRILEAKSKFYERMTKTGGALNSDDNCLVLFNRKQQDEKPDPGNETFQKFDEKLATRNESSSDSESDFEDSITNTDPEDWVEYIDCLGRTRSCLRKDLEHVKKRDSELAASMPERLDQSKANWMIDTKGTRKSNNEDNDDDEDLLIGPPAPTESIFSDGCSLMSKHDEQRINWEKKEQENLGKSEVHYQDVFFDEARQHGVGYYAFSTDEEERQRQQQELEETRQRTIDEQERRDELRAQREKVIEERVRAARNRQRARLGLPPLQAEDFEKEKLEKLEVKETKDERKARKRAEKQQRRKDEEEELREKERQEHVRPWDKEKEGVKVNDKPKSSADGFVTGEDADEKEEEWKYIPERLPMSQEQWNEKKRAERKSEFAPVPEPEPRLKRTNFSNTVENVESYDHLMPPPAAPFSTFVNFQSSKREKTFQRKNYTTSSEDSDDRAGAAIPPPDNLDSDYGLPPHAKRPKTSSELESSIEAGLRFLRNSSDKGTMSTKSSWTAKADY